MMILLMLKQVGLSVLITCSYVRAAYQYGSDKWTQAPNIRKRVTRRDSKKRDSQQICFFKKVVISKFLLFEEVCHNDGMMHKLMLETHT